MAYLQVTVSPTDPVVQQVLDFWFGTPGSPEYQTLRKIWFRGGTPEFDQKIRDKFLSSHEAAAAGSYDEWIDSVDGCLALLILLDQFPRNMFRRMGRAFATDTKAREIAKHAVAQGFDKAVHKTQRNFFYLPYEHSEELTDQIAGIELMKRTGSSRSIHAAQEHHDIIEKFGRFPHRNQALGRESTPEEIQYMKDGGKSFGQGDKPDPPPDWDEDDKT